MNVLKGMHKRVMLRKIRISMAKLLNTEGLHSQMVIIRDLGAHYIGREQENRFHDTHWNYNKYQQKYAVRKMGEWAWLG